VKRLAAEALPRWARSAGRRTVRFGSLVSSPIDRTFCGQAHAGAKAFKAAYTTAVVGC
jgi:hypothetical protein